ncbi:MAG: ATP phosphoribosyltransferase regulatory subunit, partial [Chlamydiota bacterium]|nr:ATP phosphoribosyltransferase regulatory subunit [Chlamydiota bacterium]
MIKSVRGTYDILPADIEQWYFLEETARKVFMTHCFHEIRTPIFENTELFSRSIGEATDIVEKEMYTIAKDNGAGITLRPEATASVVRAFLEHRLYDMATVQRLFYIGPMFRHERPQAGRLRQFHQLGIELLGGSHPALDAEVIELLCVLLCELGLRDYILKINTLGTLT